MMMLHWLIVCIKCYLHLTSVPNCPFILYYSPYKITVMIECITMNWDQCRDIKYDTLTQNSIQWKWEIIDYFLKLWWTWHPSYCYTCNIRTWLSTKKNKNKQNKQTKTNMILCKFILRSDEQYDYKLGFYLPAVM
jgi:hypothetical protein